MEHDLTWLIGRTLNLIEFRGFGSWRFGFGADGLIQADCPWRLVREGRIALSSEDHGHQYGLTQPVDATVACQSQLGGLAVVAVAVRGETCDLLITFATEARLELIPLSSGYESWHVFGPEGRHIVALGGGGLTGWGPVSSLDVI